MKHYIFIILINIILGTLQISFFYRIFGGSLNPNLVAAFAFSLFFSGALAFQAKRAERAYLSALVGGIFLDLMGFGTVGASSFILITCLLLAFYVKKYIFKGWATQILSLFITSIVYTVAIGLPNFYFDPKIIFSSIVTVVISVIFYWRVGFLWRSHLA